MSDNYDDFVFENIDDNLDDSTHLDQSHINIDPNIDPNEDYENESEIMLNKRELFSYGSACDLRMSTFERKEKFRNNVVRKYLRYKMESNRKVLKQKFVQFNLNGMIKQLREINEMRNNPNLLMNEEKNDEKNEIEDEKNEKNDEKNEIEDEKNENIKIIEDENKENEEIELDEKTKFEKFKKRFYLKKFVENTKREKKEILSKYFYKFQINGLNLYLKNLLLNKEKKQKKIYLMTDSQLKNSTLNKSTDSSKFKDILKEIPKLKISENLKTENKKNIEIIDENNNNNNNENETINKEIKNLEKKEEEKKVNKHFQRWDSSFMEKADPEKLRRKRLRDLFYKKINEKFDYLHRMFVKFYYKGLYFQMLHPQPQKKTNHSPKKSPRGVILNSNRNNTIDNEEKVEEKKEKIEPKKEKIEPKKEKIEPKKIEEKKIEIEKPKKNVIKTEININQPQIEEKEDLRSKAKNLRKLIRNKNKHNKDTLKTYFYKFYMHGVICSIKREGRRLIRQKTEKGLKTKNKNSNDNEQDDYHKKLNNFINHTSSKKAAEILKKKEQEETKLEHLLYIKQRKTFLVLKTILNKWNLTAKILKLSSGNNTTEVDKKRSGKRHKSQNPTKIKKKGISVSKKPKIKGTSLNKNELPPQTKIKAIENEFNHNNNNNVNINTLKKNKDDSINIISGKKMEDYLKGFDILNRDNFKNRQSKSPNKKKLTAADFNNLRKTYKKDDLLKMIHNMKEKKEKNNINLNMFTKYGKSKLNDSQNQIGNNSHIK
jgi:hypothetical protein